MDTKARGSQHTFAIGTHLFIRVLAVAYIAAFTSFWVQAEGLIGPHGILPAGEFLKLARENLGNGAWYEVPTLCWVFGTGGFISVACAAGILAALMVLLDFAPAAGLLAAWACYLSLCSAGQIFMDFQWDALLLESTLVAIFLVPWRLRAGASAWDPPRLARYLAWWLLFRLMFSSGAVKLTSGDTVWRNLEALLFHYETQPLPTPLGWYAAKLPHAVQVASCAVMFAIELLAPFGLALGRRARHVSAIFLILLQVAIALTGNYAFFNFLAIGLCLTAFDDEAWRYIHWRSKPAEPATALRGPAGGAMSATFLRWFAALSVGFTFFSTVADVFAFRRRPAIVNDIEAAVAPLRSFNSYGLFRVMTQDRPELTFEGSNDNKNWLEYELPYKPGDLRRRPPWVAPHQPRLDWMLWFAALSPPEYNPWVGTVCERIMRGEPHVLALFSKNPFPEHPPKYMRVVRYTYKYTDAKARSVTGNWWRRTPVDLYLSPVTLPENAR